MLHRLHGSGAAAAYRRSLAIKVKNEFRSGEANTLMQLGNLYRDRPRVTFADALHAGKTYEIERILAELTEPSWEPSDR